MKGKEISKADLDPHGSQACIRYGELYTRYGETIREVVSRTKVPTSELFLSYYLNGPKRLDIAKVAQGDTVVHLYPHQLEALHIAVPKPAEQQRIAECLSSLDDLIAAHARKLDALKTHKKGLMQQLFPSPEKVEA